MVIGHLGSRVSALLDGQLPPEEEERAWAHVHACHACRDLVEREGWVKTRLAGLSFGPTPVPGHLKGALKLPLGGVPVPGAESGLAGMTPGDALLASTQQADSHRRAVGLAALGGGAVSAAVVGVLALGAAPADTPSPDRRLPVTTQVTSPAVPQPTRQAP